LSIFLGHATRNPVARYANRGFGASQTRCNNAAFEAIIASLQTRIIHINRECRGSRIIHVANAQIRFV
jgi:hypothetical protein